jgi:Mlc titration factor MtfA (ptsG expression regulator)
MSFILDNIILILAMIFLALFVWFWISYRKVAHPKWKQPTEAFPPDWRMVLKLEVAFYDALDQQEKSRFEFKVQEFLLNCKITGVKTEVSLNDQLLVASSAVIPIFAFDNWRYTNIREVLLYPTTFDHNFQFENQDSERRVLGMVGSHNMEGLMILSKEALELGFKNETDKRNTAIHEFVHLIDKSDGEVDGIPHNLLEKQYIIPWLHVMNEEVEKIRKGKSDINPYGATNRAEFFSVASEYFLERPKLLEDKHPELYQLLEKTFAYKQSV